VTFASFVVLLLRVLVLCYPRAVWRDAGPPCTKTAWQRPNGPNIAVVFRAVSPTSSRPRLPWYSPEGPSADFP